jgi:hypothetical protein
VAFKITFLEDISLIFGELNSSGATKVKGGDKVEIKKGAVLFMNRELEDREIVSFIAGNSPSGKPTHFYFQVPRKYLLIEKLG